MTRAQNILRAVRFERPDHVPVSFHINAACWQHYPHVAIQELMASHPLLFGPYTPREKVEPWFSPVQRKDSPYTDPWGCVWETAEDGITGTVTCHPLDDWSRLDGFVPPDPGITDGLIPIDWTAVAADMAATGRNGGLAQAGLRHGYTFLQLCDLRGYVNVMLDMADDSPRLWRLIDMLESFNIDIVRRWLQCGAVWMGYPDDLGMQNGPMISPEHFRRFIKPSYIRLMQPARDAGCVIHMHADGDIRTLADDMVDSGVEVLNLQDLVNGIDWIAARFAGNVCIELDIDRQSVTRHGTPAQIDRLIREEVTKLGRREGGLMLIYGWYPGVPLENANAVMDAMERYSALFT